MPPCWFVHWWLASDIVVSGRCFIFSSLNGLNLKLQGQHNDVFRNWKHILAFQKSLKLWLAWLRRPNPSHSTFPTVLQHVDKTEVTATDVKQQTGLIQTYLAALIDNFYRCFPTERCDVLRGKKVDSKSLKIWKPTRCWSWNWLLLKKQLVLIIKKSSHDACLW